MPNQGLSRFIPLVVVLTLIVALTAYFAPGMIRAWHFRSTANALLAEVQAGQVGNIPNYVVAPQRGDVAGLVQQYNLAQYVPDLRSLKLTSYYREDDRIWSIVTAKHEQGITQAKLLWEWTGARWELNLLSSYWAPFNAAGEPNWQSIGGTAALSEFAE
jgi:hypothetical protein